jgi:hypothetical protein
MIKVPLYVSEKLQRQVRYLCEKVWDKEWSGPLFYNTVGTFGTPDFKVFAEELYLLDIGTGSYTEYDTTDPDLIKFLMDNPSIRSMKRGHIHSHNNMGVFFSGTDDSELVENSEFHNFYVSLIVNNKNEMCAKIAFRAKVNTRTAITMQYRGVNGEDLSENTENESEETGVYSYECVIHKPDGGELEGRFLHVAEKKKQQEDKQKDKFNKPSGGPYSSSVYDGWDDNWDYSASNWNKRTTKDTSVGKWEKGHEKGMVSVTSPSYEKRSDTRGRAYNMLTKLLAIDHSSEDTLYAVLTKLHDGFYGAPSKRKSDDPKMYYDFLQKRALEFYISSFPEDQKLERFEEIFEQCVGIIDTYETGFPELVKDLSEALSLTIEYDKKY